MQGDDLKGVVRLKTVVQGQHINHNGIKLSLLGMILQLPEYATNHQRNAEGMVKYVDPKRANVTAQNIQKYR